MVKGLAGRSIFLASEVPVSICLSLERAWYESYAHLVTVIIVHVFIMKEVSVNLLPL